MSIAIKVENLSKAYMLGEIGTGTISHDIERWVAKLCGKEDPFLKIGETNDRAVKGGSNTVWSLKDINFEINQGDAVGIIGRNGAGKSTLLKILSRVTSPTKGRLSGKGRIASLLEVGTGFHPELTGKENIYLNGAILGMRKREIKKHFDAIVEFAGVERYIDTPVKRYSSGMYVRLAFAVAAHLESEILIVDEVLAVGDYEFQKKCLGKMNDVSSKDGRTILFVSHNMSAVQNLCKTGILLKNGQVISYGNSSEVIEVYSQGGDEIENTRSITLNDAYRKYDHQKEVEFIRISYKDIKVDNLFATDETLSLQIELKANKTVNGFRIATGVFKMDDTCVGVFFSEEILNANKGEMKLIGLKINNHHLAKGKYYFQFSLGKGNEKTGITDFDHVGRNLSFEIVYKSVNSKEMYLVWDNNWGSINFQDTEIELIN